jgi:hypothetical protein
MYVGPDNHWDLKSCQQKPGEFLQDYIRCFSRKCHELPNVGDADVILTFWSDMTYRTLVQELGCDQPNTIKELLVTPQKFKFWNVIKIH